jgi:hypothetical protein
VPELPRRRRPVRVVRVRFESSRLAASYLADAYEQVVPLTRRQLSSREPPAQTTRTDRRQGQGGIN